MTLSLTRYKMYSISQCGSLCVWECDTDLEDLKPFVPTVLEESSDDEETEKNKKGATFLAKL